MLRALVMGDLLIFICLGHVNFSSAPWDGPAAAARNERLRSN
jgi:hypothetical protein